MTTSMGARGFGDARELCGACSPRVESRRASYLCRKRVDCVRVNPDPTPGGVNSLDPSASWPRPPGVDAALRRRRMAAVRRALGQHDRCSSGFPATRDALGRASAAEARSVVAEPWSTVVDRVARMLARDATRQAENGAAGAFSSASNIAAHRAGIGLEVGRGHRGVRTRTGMRAEGGRESFVSGGARPERHRGLMRDLEFDVHRSCLAHVSDDRRGGRAA
jgi:hypothetical protein